MEKRTIIFKSELEEIKQIIFNEDNIEEKSNDTLTYSTKQNKKREKIATQIYHASLKDKLNTIENQNITIMKKNPILKNKFPILDKIFKN